MGIAGADDAGVIRIVDGLALVQSVDFFTPIVDDPYDWGRIAAVNALSDLYAMGADPVTALQLVGWPRDGLDISLLAEVIRGGADVMADAGCTIVGGHSIDDQEPKYGFAVTGTAPEYEITTNAAAAPGQVLFLTKPIGTGIITTAVKAGKAPDDAVAAAIRVMTTLNREAAAAARRIGVKAVTDVTGFGLLGHLSEMVRASGISAIIDVASVPLLPQVRELASHGNIPGGTKRNRSAVSSMLDVGSTADADVSILSDAQTSGGLLISVDGALADALEQALADVGVPGWRIGTTTPRDFSHGPSGQIALR